MKEDNNITDFYRRKVDAILDNQSDFSLFKPLNQEDLDEIWEEVSTEMDIGEVWNDISVDLDIVMPEHSVSGISIRSVAAILIILIGLIPVTKTTPDSEVSGQDNLAEEKQTEQSIDPASNNKGLNPNSGEQVKADIPLVLRRSSVISMDSNMATAEERSRSLLKQLIPNLVVNDSGIKLLVDSVIPDSNLHVPPDKITLEESIIPDGLFPGEMGNIKLLAKNDFNNLKTDANTSSAGSSLTLIDRGRISGGFVTMFRNTWLLNHETFSGLKNKSLNTTAPVFFPGVGVSMNYSLNNNWLLQGDGFFYSSTGQQYFDYIDGLYSRKKIILKYSTISLSVKYRITWRGSTITGTSLNLIAGGYFSVLHRADQKINAVFENIGPRFENVESQFGKFDFGIRLGSEFELRLSDKFSLAPGLFVAYGIPNIYKGTRSVQGHLIRTHNGSEGFQLTIYYHID